MRQLMCARPMSRRQQEQPTTQMVRMVERERQRQSCTRKQMVKSK